MKKEINKVEVTILGTKYLIRSEDDEAYIRELAGYVNYKLEEFVAGRSGVPLQRLVILTALNIADELFRERADRKRLAPLSRRDGHTSLASCRRLP